MSRDYIVSTRTTKHYVEGVQKTLAGYGFNSVSHLLNDFFYLIRFNAPPAGSKIKEYLQAAINGTWEGYNIPSTTTRREEIRQKTKELFIDYLTDIEGVQLHRSISSSGHTPKRYLKGKSDWLFQLLADFYDFSDGYIVSTPEAVEYITEWYHSAQMEDKVRFADGIIYNRAKHRAGGNDEHMISRYREIYQTN